MGKKRRRNSSVPMRLFRKFIILVIFIGLPVLAFTYSFKLKQITVEGNTRYTKKEIIDKIVTDKTDSNTLLFYIKYKYMKNVKIPFIEKIEFKMNGRNSVKIHVYEKMIAGCAEFMGEYMYFDKDGIIVESSPTLLPDIPLITGLKFDKIILHEKLEVQKDELFDVILNLTQLINKYKLKVSQIEFDRNLEVTIKCGDIKILLGKKPMYDEPLSDLKNILKETKGMKLTIDMRNYTKGTEAVIARPDKEN